MQWQKGVWSNGKILRGKDQVRRNQSEYGNTMEGGGCSKILESKSRKRIAHLIFREELKDMKEGICTGIGVIGSFIASMFGGWDAGIKTLVLFMAIDYISGLAVAGLFQNSNKTTTGKLESVAGWKGLCRKGMTLLFVLIAYRLDLALGVEYIRDAVIIGFMANELISIVENAGLMGLPLPAVIKKAINVLTKKYESEGDK